MNPRVKELWMEALESGKYEQGRHRLKTLVGSYCCLGVLCVLHSQETNTPWGEKLGYLGEVTVLPSEVTKWAELPAIFGASVRTKDGGLKGLTDLNDSGMPFKDIAKLIREQL